MTNEATALLVGLAALALVASHAVMAGNGYRSEDRRSYCPDCKLLEWECLCMELHSAGTPRTDAQVRS